jgi:Toprim-like/Protein of unknown function (DUF3991)
MTGHDVELEQLRAKVSCAVLLERLPPPWQLDKQQSTRRCLKYRRAEGEVLLVTHAGRGWWDPGSTAKGDVFRLVQYLNPGLNFGEVRKVLRPFIGLSPSYPVHEGRSAKNRPDVPFGVKWDRRPVPARGSPTWRYLTETRQIPAPVVVAAIRAGALREGPHASAWFAHRDPDGRLTGIEMRGPAYRGFSPGGAKTLFCLPGRLRASAVPVRRLLVAEAPIDAMSVAAIEHLRADTLYVATAGGMGPQTLVALDLHLRALAAEGGVLVVATDNDRAGDRYNVQLATMAQAAGVRVERLLPPPDQDWNDVLRQGRGA